MAKSPYIKENSLFQIGDVKNSILSEADFQVLHGMGWILMDGRNVTGTAYHALTTQTTVPDARGVVLRGKNNGRVDGNQNPDGDLALGAFQADQYDQHNHGGGSHTHSYSGSTVETFRHSPAVASANSAGVGFTTKTTGPRSSVIANQGGNETRMRNITVNTFVKVD